MIQHRRSAVALRHVAFEDLGLLAPVMEREGWDVSFCEAAVDDLLHESIRNANLLVVLGGPIGAYETDAYGREGGTEGLYGYTVAKNVSHKMLSP
jgi:GMP synthase (glutamine-hydrolysing)